MTRARLREEGRDGVETLYIRIADQKKIQTHLPFPVRRRSTAATPTGSACAAPDRDSCATVACASPAQSRAAAPHRRQLVRCVRPPVRRRHPACPSAWRPDPGPVCELRVHTWIRFECYGHLIVRKYIIVFGVCANSIKWRNSARSHRNFGANKKEYVINRSQLGSGPGGDSARCRRQPPTQHSKCQEKKTFGMPSAALSGVRSGEQSSTDLCCLYIVSSM